MARGVAVSAYILTLISLPTILSWLAIDLGKTGAAKSLLYVGAILGVVSWISLTVRLIRPKWIANRMLPIITPANYALSLYSAINSFMSFTVAVCITIVLVFAFIVAPTFDDNNILEIQLGLVLLVLSCAIQYISFLLMLIDSYHYYHYGSVSASPTTVANANANANADIELNPINYTERSTNTTIRSSLDRASRKQIIFLANFTVLDLTIIIGAVIFTALEGWRFRQGIYFCLVTLTTIGYGNLVPTTDGAKLFLLFYGTFGLGLMAVVVSSFGAMFVNTAHRLHRNWLPKQLKPLTRRVAAADDKTARQRKCQPLWVRVWVHDAGNWLLKHFTLVIITAMVLFFWFTSALLFSLMEQWSYLNAVYFSFATLATIGYGDFIPTNPVSLAYTFFFVFVGLALFSAFLNALWNPESVIRSDY